MESKYYTPDLEEFFIGFEYEQSPKENKWFPNGLRFIETKVQSISRLPIIKDQLENKQIRVKYLDQEDIKSLGFIFQGGKLIKNHRDSFIYKVDVYKQYNLEYTYSNNIVRISIEDLNTFEENMNYLFQGIIKNKSELKKLLKQLQINE